MSDEYLWNKSGPPDPDVADLEHLLGRYAARAGDPPWLLELTAPPASRRVQMRGFLAAAAALVLACGAAVWQGQAPDTAWPVVRLTGTPVAGHTRIAGAGRLAPGEWLDTDAASSAALAVSTIGRIDVGPGTRLRLIESREGAHRLAMTRGSVHAYIWAPPGQFVIDTPSSRAVDLGCIYTLQVSPDGSGSIEVDAGWVAFEHAGREAFVAEGARCTMHPRRGPGLPYMTDAPPGVVAAVRTLDTADAAASDRADALARLLASARREDALTVWHLLARVPPVDRDAVFDALARLVPPPAGVTREGIRIGNGAMRDRWWNALELGDAGIWRTWRRRWPG